MRWKNIFNEIIDVCVCVCSVNMEQINFEKFQNNWYFRGVKDLRRVCVFSIQLVFLLINAFGKLIIEFSIRFNIW